MGNLNDTLKLENQICHRFYIASNAITRSYRPLLEKLDLTYPQYLVLLALWEKDQVFVQDIMERTKIDGGSLTQILEKLRAKGIIESKSVEEDKRKKVIALTSSGKKLKAKAKGIPEAMACKAKSLSKKEVEDLIHLLDKLNSDLYS